MQEATLEFGSPEALRSALTAALEKGFIPTPGAVPGLSKLRIHCAGKTLDLFASGKPDGYRLTDEPADLKFQITQFLAQFPEQAAAAPNPEPEADSAEEQISEEELHSIATELESKDPIVEQLKRIQKLPVPQKIKLAEDGDLVQRTLLYRMYGKLVFDGLLRNPRITEAEVAKLAKLATISGAQLQVIARRPEWVRNERIRNALLGNTRVPQAIVQKIISTLSKHELKPLLQRRDLPQAVQAAIREANTRLSR